ncbi:hypothetical protein D9M71_716890 [compost metagenome]
MVVVGMGMRLVRQVGKASVEHGGELFKFCTLYLTSTALHSVCNRLERGSQRPEAY